MRAIYKREVFSYFVTPIGYIYIGIFLALGSLIFGLSNLSGLSSDMSDFFSMMSYVWMLLTPVLVMRLIAGERKNLTDQLLMTAPVRAGDIVMGKYLALVTIYAIPIAVLATYPLIMSKFGTVAFGSAYTALLGFFLLGSANIAIGVFFSAITESQVIAAVLTFVFLFAFYMMNGISSFFSETAMSTCVTFGILIIALSLMIYSMIKNAVLSGAVCVIGEVALVIVYVVKSSVFEGGIQKVLEVFNLSSHFENFTNSIFDVTGVLYFLSVIAICIFLTMQTILKRRWN